MVAPLPLYCRDNAGSGFLIGDKVTAWLVTSVHNISGLRETPLIASIFTGAEVHVAGTPAVLPLFVSGRQRFSIVTNTTTGNLVDVIAIQLAPREIAGLLSFGMYDLGSIVQAEVGDAVTASGFPNLGQMLTGGVSKFEPIKLLSRLEEIEGVSLRLSSASAGGLSGGPVVNDLGLIGILHGYVGTATALTSALAISLHVVAGQLFR